jgi:2,3-dihydroxybenzoate decarboxylase
VEEVTLRRIAVEEAFVTEEIAEEWGRVLGRQDVEAGFRAMGSSILGTSPNAQAVHARLLDIGTGRIAHMDAHGIDMQVLSLTAPGVQVFEADLAARLARQANDSLAEAIARHPRRLAGLAAIAPQEPRDAAAELRRIAGAPGIKGWIVNSHTHGEYLDEEKFLPIFEAAQDLALPLYLHPREPSPGMVQPFLKYGLYFAGWGFAAEAGLHVMRLIMSGLFDRFPKLQIVLGHMGEGIPFWLQRIDNRYALQVKLGDVRELPRLPSEYFRDHFTITTSGVCFEPALRLAIDVMGAERVMFAVDYPYESAEEAVAFLDGARISERERRLIYGENARRVFRLDDVIGSASVCK